MEIRARCQGFLCTGRAVMNSPFFATQQVVTGHLYDDMMSLHHRR
jgi:hypothetical protein